MLTSIPRTYIYCKCIVSSFDSVRSLLYKPCFFAWAASTSFLFILFSPLFFLIIFVIRQMQMLCNTKTKTSRRLWKRLTSNTYHPTPPPTQIYNPTEQLKNSFSEMQHKKLLRSQDLQSKEKIHTPNAEFNYEPNVPWKSTPGSRPLSLSQPHCQTPHNSLAPKTKSLTPCLRKTRIHPLPPDQHDRRHRTHQHMSISVYDTDTKSRHLMCSDY